MLRIFHRCQIKLPCNKNVLILKKYVQQNTDLARTDRRPSWQRLRQHIGGHMCVSFLTCLYPLLFLLSSYLYNSLHCSPRVWQLLPAHIAGTYVALLFIFICWIHMRFTQVYAPRSDWNHRPSFQDSARRSFFSWNKMPLWVRMSIHLGFCVCFYLYLLPLRFGVSEYLLKDSLGDFLQGPLISHCFAPHVSFQMHSSK